MPFIGHVDNRHNRINLGLAAPHPCKQHSQAFSEALEGLVELPQASCNPLVQRLFNYPHIARYVWLAHLQPWPALSSHDGSEPIETEADPIGFPVNIERS